MDWKKQYAPKLIWTHWADNKGHQDWNSLYHLNFYLPCKYLTGYHFCLDMIHSVIAGTNLPELQSTHLKVLLEPGQDINPLLLNGPQKSL